MIEIINADDTQTRILTALIESIEGTIPGSRGFGLSGAMTDLPPEEAMNELYAELDEKVEDYLPDITISNIELIDASDGRADLRIYVEENEDD